MNEYASLVIIIRILIVILGVFLTWKTITLSKKSRENNFAYRFLALGFLIFTIAQVLEGVLFEFTNISIEWIHIIEGVLSSISFILIILSISKFQVPID